MKLDFIQNTTRNLVADISLKLLMLLLPFLNRTLFLWLLSPQYLGLNGLFSSILGVLSLAELGFGAAIGISMYKPVAEDNRALLCAYLRFYRTIYRLVGLVILGLGLALLPFLGKLVHGDVPPDINLHLLYLIHLANTVVSYAFFAYRGSVLGAYHRYDLLTKIRIFTTITQYLTSATILLLTRNYYYYVFATMGFTVLTNLLIYRQATQYFPNIVPDGDLDHEKRAQILANVKDLIFHKVGTVIAYSFDNIVISAILGLTALAAYGNYYYVVTAVGGLTTCICHSAQAGIGNRLHLSTNEENFQLLMKIHRLVALVIFWASAIMLALYQPFITLWTRKQPELMRHSLTAVLMVTYFYISQARKPVLVFKDAAGLWRKDRWKALIAALANLTLNLLFIIILPTDYKLDGVILSTILAFLVIEMPWETRALFTSLFNARQAKHYWLSQLRMVAFALALGPLPCCLVHAIHLPGVPGFLVKAAVAVATATAIGMLIFHRDLKGLWNTLGTRLKAKA